MFLGTHSPRMDDKGRLVLPAKFREELADGVVLTRGQEHCLYVFGAQEFRRIHEAIRQAPLTSRQARDFLRLFLSGASDQVPDRQGRITVPPDLRRYAGLTPISSSSAPATGPRSGTPPRGAATSRRTRSPSPRRPRR